MSLEGNKAIAQRFCDEVWNSGDARAAGEILAPRIVRHGGEATPTTTDRDAYMEYVAALRRALPDLRCSIVQMVAEGDTVAVRYAIRGTHLGEWAGIAPSGRVLDYPSVDFLRIHDGQIQEVFGLADSGAVLRQMGVIPALGGKA